MSFRGTVLIAQNPVLAIETYSRTLTPWSGLQDKTSSHASLMMSNRKIGGHYSADFLVHAPDSDLCELFLSGLMRDVKIYSPDTIQLWNGFIYEMTFRYKGCAIMTSMQDVANKITMEYRIKGSNTHTLSTVSEDTASQLRYGIKEKVINGGEQYSGDVAKQACDTLIAGMGAPEVALEELQLANIDSRPAQVKVKCYGYWKTLEWQIYAQTTDDDFEPVSNQMEAIVDGAGQFIRSWNITPNGTPVPQYLDGNQSAWEQITALAKMGDASLRAYTVGVDGDREFFYRPEVDAV